jgi:hypothetical protein
VFILAAGRRGIRLMLFAVFVIVYFGGHPAIQFLPRHYFPFEVLAWSILAFLVERAVRLGLAFVRDRSIAVPAIADVRHGAVCAALVIALLVLPLAPLRWYQQGRATRLLESYAASSGTSTPLEVVAPGQFRVPIDPGAARLSTVEALAALGHVKTFFVEVDLNVSACRPGTTVTYRYDRSYPDIDFSRTMPIESGSIAPDPTRIFEPAYAQFQGVDVTDGSPECVRRVSMLKNLEQWPLLLPAHLTPGWASHAQYQRIADSR